MPINVILEMKSSSDKIEELKAYLSSILPVTRQYFGYINLEVLSSLDDANELVIYETWESREAYQKYFNWRAETGVFDKLGEMIVGEPKVRFLENIGI
jgi:quinol monooxygenase YgiN